MKVLKTRMDEEEGLRSRAEQRMREQNDVIKRQNKEIIDGERLRRDIQDELGAKQVECDKLYKALEVSEKERKFFLENSNEMKKLNEALNRENQALTR